MNEWKGDGRDELLRRERNDNMHEHEYGQHAPHRLGWQYNCPLCEQDSRPQLPEGADLSDLADIPARCEI